MDGKMLTRLLAVVLIAIAITATAIGMARNNEPAASDPVLPVGADAPGTDPMRNGLLRCQAMGEAAIRDAGCLSAWAENRRRFLGRQDER